MGIVNFIGELILKIIERILHPKKKVEVQGMVDSSGTAGIQGIMGVLGETGIQGPPGEIQEPPAAAVDPSAPFVGARRFVWNSNPLSDLKDSTVTITPYPHSIGDAFSLNPYYRECLDDIKEVHGVTIVGRVANKEEARLGINFVKNQQEKIEPPKKEVPILNRYEIMRKKLEGKNGNI